jgi:hypothetical protein
MPFSFRFADAPVSYAAVIQSRTRDVGAGGTSQSSPNKPPVARSRGRGLQRSNSADASLVPTLVVVRTAAIVRCQVEEVLHWWSRRAAWVVGPASPLTFQP